MVYPKEVHVTTNDIDTKALLDQIYFALDAKAFGVFQDMLDHPPVPTRCLRRTLLAPSPWDAPSTSGSKAKQVL